MTNEVVPARRFLKTRDPCPLPKALLGDEVVSPAAWSGVQTLVTHWRAGTALFAGWTALALFLAAGNSLTYLSTGQSGSWRLTISLSLAQWWVWALLTPLIVRWSRKWPIRPIRRFDHARPILMHSAVGLPLAFGKTVVDRALRGFITGVTPYFLISNITFQFVIYWVIVAVVHAMESHRRERERERRSAQLETRLAEAKLQLLRAQLQPHFLFNTLNAIAELVHESPAAADRMITGLGELLRQATGSSERISLAEELDLVKRYVDIQQGRFGDRLRLAMEVDPEVLTAQVPTMLLQPIVENSLRHGLAQVANGRIEVRAKRQGTWLSLEVRDNGIGLPAGGLKEGLGLGNTRARLEAAYGRDHRFEVGNLAGEGLQVSIDLPLESEVG